MYYDVFPPVERTIILERWCTYRDLRPVNLFNYVNCQNSSYPVVSIPEFVMRVPAVRAASLPQHMSLSVSFMNVCPGAVLLDAS